MACIMRLFCVLAMCAATGAGMGVGVNIQELGNMDALWPFVDLMKHASKFFVRNWDASRGWVYEDPRSVTFDAESGYPALIGGSSGRLTAAVSYLSFNPAVTYGEHPPVVPGYLPGRYVLLWQGGGNLTLSGDATVAVSSLRTPGATPGADSGSGGDNRATFDITTASAGIILAITATDPSNPLRAVRIYPADLEASGRVSDRGAASFAPRFLALARRFSVLRFTGWQREAFSSSAAGSATLMWEGRVLPSAPSQVQAGGVALEHVVDLCAAAPAAPWLSIPAAAAPSYIRGMTRMLVEQLLLDSSYPATLNIHLEYSAEVGLTTTQGALAMAAFGEVTATLQTLAQERSLSYDALRSRFVFVGAVSAPEYFPHFLTFWSTALQAAAAAGTLPGGGAVVQHPLQLLDAVALPGTFGRQLGWHEPAFNVSSVAGWSDAQLLQAVYSCLLLAELDIARLSNRLDSFAWNLTAVAGPVWTGSNPRAVPGTAATDYAGGLGRRLPLLMYAAGAQLGAADFGARFAVQQNRSGATPAMMAAADAEAAWADRVIALQRQPEFSRLTVQWYRRLAAAGVQAAVAPDLARPASAAFAWQLALRRSGNTAAFEGWQVGYAAVKAGCTGSSGALAARPSVPEVNGTMLTAAEAAALLAGGADSAVVACHVTAVINSSPKLHGAVTFFQQPDTLPDTAASAGVPGVDTGSDACSPPPRYGVCYRGRAHCYAGITGATCDTVMPAGDPRSEAAVACAHPGMGVNIGGVADWSTAFLYADAHKASRAWIAQPGWAYPNLGWSFGAVPALDEAGYPAALLPGLAVGTLHLRDLDGHYRQGWYAVTWEGDGVLSASMTDVQEVVYDAPGRMRVRLLPGTSLNNGLFLRIERSNPADPVRGIRVLMPNPSTNFSNILGSSTATLEDRLRAYSDAMSVAEAFPFHPFMLAYLKNFTVLRTMDLQGTNTGATAHMWQERPQPHHRSFALGAGVPPEHLLLLANSVGASLWLNVPHTADDGWVTDMARLAVSQLRPDVKLYVEYANEVWGTLFPAGKHAQAEGLAMELDADPTEARFCYYAWRSRAIFAIFEAVWTAPAGEGGLGPAGRDRLVFVAAGQAVNADVAARILGCNASWLLSPGGGRVDAIAMAPYLDADLTRGNTGRDTDLLDVDTVMNTSFPAGLQRVQRYVMQHAAVAAASGVKLFTYEAGQGIVGSGDRQVALAIAANRHPAMSDIYYRYLRTLFDSGVELAMQFTAMDRPSQYGSWGLVEAMDFTPATAYKWNGTMTLIAEGRQCPAAADDREVTSGADADAACPVGEDEGGARSSCSGHGFCIDTPLPGGKAKACSCHNGWNGAACDEGTIVDYSTCSYQCSGHGVCTVVKQEGYKRYSKCVCAPGYSGDRCTIFSCPEQCNYQGKCVDAGVCACFEGYGGGACAIDCGARGHGACAWQRGINGTAAPTATSPAAAVCDAGYAFVPAVGEGQFLRGPAPAAQWYAAGSCKPVCTCATAAQTCLAPGLCSPELPCKYGDYLQGRCVCWSGYGGRDCSLRLRPRQMAATGSLASTLSPMGINLAGISDWSTDTPFCDLMRVSRPWISQWVEAWRPGSEYIWSLGNDRSPQNLSTQGWPRALLPGQALATLMARDVQQRLLSGRYVVTYKGRGELTFGFDARVVSQRRGRIELDVTLSPTPGVRDNGIFMKVEATDPADPIRDIQVWMPGPACEAARLAADSAAAAADEAAAATAAASSSSATTSSPPPQPAYTFPFHQDWLDNLRSMSFGAIRFMDLMHTNAAPTDFDSSPLPGRTWARRPQVGDARWTHNGVPLEVMIHLCNILGADPWFNLPHDASEDYVSSFAALVRSQLRPDLSVYIEFSNEVWHTLFDSGKALYAEAAALGVYASQLHGQKSLRMMQAWERVWGAEARAARLIHVFATATGNSWYTRIALANRTVLDSVDAVGVTAYIDCGGLGSPRNAGKTAAQSVEWVLRRCMDVLPQISTAWDAQLAVIDQLLLQYNTSNSGAGATPTASASPSPSATPTPSASASASPSAGSSGSAADEPGVEFPFEIPSSRPSSRIPGSGGKRLPLVVYEGGPGLVEQDAIEHPGHEDTPGLQALFTAVARDPRMETLYRAYLDSFSVLGLAGGRGASHPFMHFSSTGVCSRYGCWGLQEYTGQPLADAPKARAVTGFIRDVVANLTRTGCMDAAAVNFDPLARISNESCAYPPTPVSGAGAVIAPAGLAVRLSIPPGAVTGGVAVPITLQQVPLTLSTGGNASGELGGVVSEQQNKTVMTQVVRFGPPGTTFAVPVTVCLPLEDDAAAVAANSSAAASDGTSSLTLQLYHSQDGVIWYPVADSSLQAATTGSNTNTTLQLCGGLWHFTLAAGMQVSAAQLAVDVAQAQAGSNSGGGSGSGSGSEPGSALVRGLAAAGAVVAALILLGLYVKHRRRAARMAVAASDASDTNAALKGGQAHAALHLRSPAAVAQV